MRHEAAYRLTPLLVRLSDKSALRAQRRRPAEESWGPWGLSPPLSPPCGPTRCPKRQAPPQVPRSGPMPHIHKLGCWFWGFRPDPTSHQRAEREREPSVRARHCLCRREGSPQPVFRFLLCWDLRRKSEIIPGLRPEAKPECWELRARNPNSKQVPGVLFRSCCRDTVSATDSRSTYSHDFFR
jgi:hypothetical protein